MLPANLLNALKEYALAQKTPLPVAAAVASAKTGQQFEPGQQLQGSVQAQVAPNVFKVNVAGQLIQMQLPPFIRSGDNVALKVVSLQPSLTFSLINSTKPLSTPEQLGSAARLLSSMSQQPPDKAYVRAVRTAPLWETPNPPESKQLAGMLREALSNSGLFYESHQAQWLGGARSTAQLLQEPQNLAPEQARTAAATPTPKAVLPRAAVGEAIDRMPLSAEHAVKTASSEPVATASVAGAAAKAAPEAAIVRTVVAGEAPKAAAGEVAKAVAGEPAAKPMPTANAAADAIPVPAASGEAAGKTMGETGAKAVVVTDASGGKTPLPEQTVNKAAAATWEAASKTVVMQDRADAATNRVDAVKVADAGAPPQQAAAALPEAKTLGIPEHLQPLVQQQLNALETSQMLWQGTVWPGQDMQWEIHEQASQSPTMEGQRQWVTQIQLDLPNLGQVGATLRFNNAGLSLTLNADAAGTRAVLGGASTRLVTALTEAGIPVLSTQVVQ